MQALTGTDRARILIVEDEGIVASDMERSLSESFVVTDIAASAEEAIASATRHKPDLVLMDIRIRGKLDGVETAGLLREKFDIPVVYLTAHGDRETVERADRTEPYGYLLKPFKRPDLLSTVRIALQRHGMEKELRAREHLLETTLRSISEAVIMTDREGRVTLLNPSAEALTGWKTADAQGKPATEVFALQDERTSAAMESPIARALRDGATVHVESGILVGKNGVRHPIADSASPIVDGPNVYGAVMVLRDMSGARRMQRQLEFADRLASLGTMAAGVAHEINNPLAFIVANLDHAIGELGSHVPAIASGRVRPEDSERLDDVLTGLREAKEGTYRVARIVSDLRDFSRDEHASTGNVEVKRVIDWALNVTAHTWKHRAHVVRDYQDVPHVRADEGRLSQIIVNLVVNAAQALPLGRSREHEIRIATRTARNGDVLISVHDTGPGMPEEILARVFEPFFTTKQGGGGLGLSICHGIITSLGGSIHVTSNVGRGTTFEVRLPSAGHAGLPSPPKMLAARAIEPGPQAPRYRVLVVDDDPLVRSAIGRTLQHRYDVTMSGSVKEAWQALDRGSFDAILCDLLMPQESGMDFYDQLAERKPDVLRRVIFLTGGAFSEEVTTFLTSVRRPTLEKPFDGETLHALVTKIVSATKSS